MMCPSRCSPTKVIRTPPLWCPGVPGQASEDARIQGPTSPTFSHCHFWRYRPNSQGGHLNQSEILILPPLHWRFPCSGDDLDLYGDLNTDGGKPKADDDDDDAYDDL